MIMGRILMKNQRGFSLVEALIAILLLGVGMLATGLMQIGGIEGNANATGRTVGLSLAQSIMEDLRGRPLDDPLLSDVGGQGLDDGMATVGQQPNPSAADCSAGQITTSDGRNYTVFWNVAEDMPVTKTKTVRLFVYWSGPKFGQHRIVLTTVLGGFYL